MQKAFMWTLLAASSVAVVSVSADAWKAMGRFDALVVSVVLANTLFEFAVEVIQTQWPQLRGAKGEA